jgi:RHS repeat-associated protein
LSYDNHFGKIVEHTKIIETNNPYGYTGREIDTEDLYYYRARYYDPIIQRFLSEYPKGFASGDFNWYRYVGNSPVNWIDPLGLWSMSLELYDFFGGGATFGRNLDGRFFLSIKVDIGIGAGASFDPNGTSSNYNSNGCYDSGAGFTGGINIDLPFVSLGYGGSFGAMTGQEDILSSLYTNIGPNVSLDMIVVLN